jgi:hypothetical protein
MSVQRPGTAVTAGRRPPSLAGERLLRVQPDQPAAAARLLPATPERWTAMATPGQAPARQARTPRSDAAAINAAPLTRSATWRI